MESAGAVGERKLVYRGMTMGRARAKQTGMMPGRRSRSNRVALGVLACLALGFAGWLAWVAGEWVTVTCTRGQACAVVASNLCVHDTYAVAIAGGSVRIDRGGRSGAIIEVREPGGTLAHIPARRTTDTAELEDAARVLTAFAVGQRETATVVLAPGFDYYIAHGGAAVSVGFAGWLAYSAARGKIARRRGRVRAA